MTELNDYSGPFNPDLKFKAFSKAFILDLIKIWQWSWIQLDAAYFEQVLKRSDLKLAFKCDTEMWLRVAERVNPIYARIAKIPMTNVVDCHKVYQLPLDNSMGTIYGNEYDIKDEFHSIFSVVKCPSLEWCEDNAPERIVPMCHELDWAVIDKYKVNMDVKLTPVKLAPRKSRDEPACTWELKLDVPEATPRRSLKDLIDWTDDPPEVDDLRGPFYPNMTHSKFTKGFLLRMMDAWQYGWTTMAEAYFSLSVEHFGMDTANEMSAGAWDRVTQRVQPRYAKVAKLALNTVLDSLKCMQLAMDTPIGPLFTASYNIRNDNHVIMTIAKRVPSTYPDWESPDLSMSLCQGDWSERLKSYLVNPAITITPLTPVPKAGQADIESQWELTMGT